MSSEIAFGERTKEYIEEIFDLHQMIDLLTSLQKPFPHLTFGKWLMSNPPRRREFADITTENPDRTVLRVRIRLAAGRGIACRVGTLAGVPVPKVDREAVHSFANFVGTLVESLGFVSRLAVSQRRRTDILPAHIDLGTLAVGQYLWTLARLRFDPTPILLHLRSLSQQSYENKKVPYGLIFSRRPGGLAPYPDEVRDNRRFVAVSDGLRTAVKLDRQARVLGLAALDQDVDAKSKAYRPRRFRALAAGSAKELLGLGLSEEGDIVCLHKGSMILSLSHGSWQVWNHAENVAVLRRAIQGTCPGSRRSEEIAHSIYAAALDLSFQRRGALFVVLPGSEKLSALIEEEQKPDHPGRHVSDRSLDMSVVGQDVARIPREVLCDLAALDGAVIVDPQGKCLAYAAIIKLTPEGRRANRGARTQATREASLHGVALMVSADGGIEIVAADRTLLLL